MENRLALSVDEFCAAHDLSRAMFYELIKRGDGPVLMRIGRRTLVSVEAAAAWRRKIEARTASDLASGLAA